MKTCENPSRPVKLCLPSPKTHPLSVAERLFTELLDLLCFAFGHILYNAISCDDASGRVLRLHRKITAGRGALTRTFVRATTVQ